MSIMARKVPSDRGSDVEGGMFLPLSYPVTVRTSLPVKGGGVVNFHLPPFPGEAMLTPVMLPIGSSSKHITSEDKKAKAPPVFAIRAAVHGCPLGGAPSILPAKGEEISPLLPSPARLLPWRHFQCVAPSMSPVKVGGVKPLVPAPVRLPPGGH